MMLTSELKRNCGSLKQIRTASCDSLHVFWASWTDLALLSEESRGERCRILILIPNLDG
jgi:hypothetical protein